MVSPQFLIKVSKSAKSKLIKPGTAIISTTVLINCLTILSATLKASLKEISPNLSFNLSFEIII
ncbi:Uncharacterised protein [Chlamydia trachomatis]|nr:Uncharacterised protein [Chlamydia trachomatis]